ncbi:hypothetical protein HAX54_019355 [Datura stramonium]|uniref:Uncharacterized protein n=1 Tax=Datura stramonium TaxID=4076 RepID=A0ABS8URC6_DATST|nr:hypothetical protein [Datura stramonium]
MRSKIEQLRNELASLKEFIEKSFAKFDKNESTPPPSEYDKQQHESSSVHFKSDYHGSLDFLLKSDFDKEYVKETLQKSDNNTVNEVGRDKNFICENDDEYICASEPIIEHSHNDILSDYDLHEDKKDGDECNLNNVITCQEKVYV